MNAAARLVHRNVIARHLNLTHLLTHRQIAFLMLATAVLLTALSIIYVTQTTRVLHANYQQNRAEQAQLREQQSQYLLERSVWMMQGRTQDIAQSQLGMNVPDAKAIIVIHEPI